MINVEQYLGFMNQQVIEVTEATNKRFLNNLWNNVVEGNPVKSGLSRYSWRLVGGEPTGYLPKLGNYNPKDGTVFGYPAKPKALRTGKTFKQYSMFNNQNYVVKLNESETKYYYQFINNGIAKATMETKVGP